METSALTGGVMSQCSELLAEWVSLSLTHTQRCVTWSAHFSMLKEMICFNSVPTLTYSTNTNLCQDFTSEKSPQTPG